MNDPFLYVSAGLSIIAIIAYLTIIARGHRKIPPRLADAVVAVLSSAGVASGVKVCLLAFDVALQQFE